MEVQPYYGLGFRKANIGIPIIFPLYTGPSAQVEGLKIP